MKLDTRIELVVLIAGAVVAGSWLGLKMTRGSAPEGRQQEAEVAQSASAPVPRIMTAPSATRPLRTLAVEIRKEPENAPATAAATLAPPTSPVPDAGSPANVDDPSVLSHLPDDALGQLLNDGKKFEARALLTRRILAEPEGDRRDKFRTLLDQINADLFFSRNPSPDCVFYAVQPGDALSRIATKTFKRDHFFSGLIMRINGIRDAKKIQPNQKLKIPKGAFSAIVQKRTHRLIVFLNGHYIKEYPVTIGALTHPTPVAKFVVANSKMENPPWTDRTTGSVYQYGDPRNILGTRWIGFEETGEYWGLGIHGTSDPSSIGKNASNGCIRMLNKDVEEVFGMLMPGEFVEVLE